MSNTKTCRLLSLQAVSKQVNRSLFTVRKKVQEFKDERGCEWMGYRFDYVGSGRGKTWFAVPADGPPVEVVE